MSKTCTVGVGLEGPVVAKLVVEAGVCLGAVRAERIVGGSHNGG